MPKGVCDIMHHITPKVTKKMSKKQEKIRQIRHEIIVRDWKE